jgi:hypothetical protein
MKINNIASLVIGIGFFFLLTASSIVFAQSGQMGFSSVVADRNSAGTISKVSLQTIEDVHQHWTINEWIGLYVSCTGSNNMNQIRRIISNTATTLTVSPAFDITPAYGSQFAIRRGYKGTAQGLKLKLYMQYNDANKEGGKLEDYSCRIQASDSTAVEFVSVEIGTGLAQAWTPTFYAPSGSGKINWLVLQSSNIQGLSSGLYHLVTVTYNLVRTEVDKPLTFTICNCPQGGVPIGITTDHSSVFFDTTTNNSLSGREEILVLHDTIASDQYLASRISETSSVISSYPNPFNPTTTVQYELSEYSFVQLVVYDMLGRAVTELMHAPQYEGSHAIRWNPVNLSSGTYFARLNIRGLITNSNTSKSLKLVYAK